MNRNKLKKDVQNVIQKSPLESYEHSKRNNTSTDLLCVPDTGPCWLHRLGKMACLSRRDEQEDLCEALDKSYYVTNSFFFVH